MLQHRKSLLIAIIVGLLYSGPSLARCSDLKQKHLTLIAESLESAIVVASVQRQLLELGYYQGEVDGKINALLTKAIQHFQKKHRLPENGVINDVLRIRLQGQSALDPASIYAEAAKGQLKKTVAQLAADLLLNVRDKNGWTPLHYATLYGHAKVASQLLKAGADINIASPYGTTSLMLAVITNRSDIVSLFLRHWPDLDIANLDGESAEGMAFMLKRHQMMRMFYRHRQKMARARLGRIPPFKVRMISWDKQECYRATTAGIDVQCQERPDCRLESHILKLCHPRGEKHLQRIFHIIQQKWGGSPKVIDTENDHYDSPFRCLEDDVMVFGVKTL